MINVMLDLETMGTRPDAPIIAIGAVVFDQDVGLLNEFYETPSLKSAVACGAVMDADTVSWWMRQSKEARALFAADTCDMEFALDRFASWVIEQSKDQLKDVRVWGNGAAFDNVLLSETYKRLKQPVPWMFYNDRCYRTVKSLHPDVPYEFIGVEHNALDDAKSQALHLIKILRG